MNFIQRAWLVALRPVISLVNDKMATRSGILGRIGKFYAFGPREFGYHPINRWFAYVNQIMVLNIGISMHRYSFMKYDRNLTQGPDDERVQLLPKPQICIAAGPIHDLLQLHVPGDPQKRRAGRVPPSITIAAPPSVSSKDASKTSPSTPSTRGPRRITPKSIPCTPQK